MGEDIFIILVCVFGAFIGIIIVGIYVILDKKFKRMSKEKKRKAIKWTVITVYLVAWIGGILIMIWIWINLFWFFSLIFGGCWFLLIFNPFFDWEGRFEAQQYRQQEIQEQHNRRKKTFGRK